jgi:hypothetical protein
MYDRFAATANVRFPPKPDTTPAPSHLIRPNLEPHQHMRPEEADQRHIRRVARPLPRRSARYGGLLFPGSKPVADTDGAAVKRVPDVLECHLMAGTGTTC